MSKLISKIISGIDCDIILDDVLSRIYQNGPISAVDMETLSFISLYQPELFNTRIDEILLTLGLFFKDGETATGISAEICNAFKEVINQQYNGKYYYTPLQQSIANNVSNNRVFSFSAPTSTGKSYLLMNLIAEASGDVLVIVPSRALINEYYIKLTDKISDHSVNILTHIDKINTRNCKRSIFVVTPERCREIFKNAAQYNVSLIIFDEAQLSNEENKRGIFFDSIVRRCQKYFSGASFLFAHPFVSNPEAQITKNRFPAERTSSCLYCQRNIGQIFISKRDNDFFYFSIDPATKRERRIACEVDPIKDAILSHGSVLFYVSKNSITTNTFLNNFSEYIDLCEETQNPQVDKYISKLQEYTGGGTIANKNGYSQLLALMKRGIVVHHGSLPLEARTIIENYTKDGLCRICFATSTLEQGINMPFDVIFLDRLETSRVLSVKNLIGRAGRSTSFHKFDIGRIVIEDSKVSRFRTLFAKDIKLESQSLLDKESTNGDELDRFKDAINNDTFSEQFNLTNDEINKLENVSMDECVCKALDVFFTEDGIISSEVLENSARRECYLESFRGIYSKYLGRQLETGEKAVLSSALEILLWRVHGRTFSAICKKRYAKASRAKSRALLEKQGRSTEYISNCPIAQYCELPDRNLKRFIPLFDSRIKAKDIDYDIVSYDTYDFIDKCLGFYLSDIFYAAFVKYYERTNDERALRLAKIVKYGTDNDRTIMCLRYGLSYEDVEKLDKYIVAIDEAGVVVNEEFNSLSAEDKLPLIRFVS